MARISKYPKQLGKTTNSLKWRGVIREEEGGGGGGGWAFIGYKKEKKSHIKPMWDSYFSKKQQISTLTNMRIPSRNFSSTKAATPPNALNDAIKLLQC